MPGLQVLNQKALMEPIWRLLAHLIPSVVACGDADDAYARICY